MDKKKENLSEKLIEKHKYIYEQLANLKPSEHDKALRRKFLSKYISDDEIDKIEERETNNIVQSIEEGGGV